jgi:alpha-ketoglutarate-dependent taurine dioxygenase
MDRGYVVRLGALARHLAPADAAATAPGRARDPTLVGAAPVATEEQIIALDRTDAPTETAPSRSAIVLALDDAQRTTVRLHPLWLRERCGKVQESTGQRLFDVADCDGALSCGPELVADGKTMRVAFEDGTVGNFAVDALCAELGLSAARNPERIPLPEKKPWSGADGAADDMSFPLAKLRQFDAQGPDPEPVLLGKIADQLLAYGAVVVRNVRGTAGPSDDAEVVKFARKLGVVRETEWGRWFDVTTKQSRDDDALAEDLAYTNEAIDVHMDNVYREPVPNFWCLHCVETGGGDDTSGMSLISDALYAAEILRQEDPVGFAVLTHVKVAFKYVADGIALVRHVPHIALAEDGVTITQLTYSGRLDAVDGATYSFETLEAYYKARARWIAIARANAQTFKLSPGDMVMLDNRRIFHGRNAIDGSYDDSAPPRFMQGCYIDCDGVESTHRVYQMGLQADAAEEEADQSGVTRAFDAWVEARD